MGKTKKNEKKSKITEKMVFGIIYNYLTGANEETTVPVRQAEPIDDWELIEDESSSKVEEPIKSQVKESNGKIQRRKNTKKINVLVSQPNYNKFLKSELAPSQLGISKSSKKASPNKQNCNPATIPQ